MQEIYVDVTATWVAAIFIVTTLLLWYLFSFWSKPNLRISNIESMQTTKAPWRQRIAFLPNALFWAALALFVLAYIDPHTYIERDADNNGGGDQSHKETPTEGIAIYLVLDNSVSMLEQLEVSTPSGRRRKIAKIDLLKDVTKRFVKGDPSQGLKGRTNDLLGIVTFARSAQVVSPLTLDHPNILEHLEMLDVNRDESQRGTALGYAIFKTANLIDATRHFGSGEASDEEPAYNIKSSVILLVTDGFQEINPEDIGNPLRSIDIVEAANYAKKENVRVYIVNIDPKITSERFADHRKLFQLLTELTGGKFFFVDSANDLPQVYSEIDQLEKSVLPGHSKADKENLPNLYRRISFYHYLIPAGMALLFLAVLLQTTFLRRVP